MSWEWKALIVVCILVGLLAITACLWGGRRVPPKPLDVQTTDELFDRWKPQGGTR